MSKRKDAPSKETIQQAQAIAKATQRPGQTKEQTKLIEKGIQKGIAEYKKRQKAKSRELDKKLKQTRRDLAAPNEKTKAQPAAELNANPSQLKIYLPWALLLLSWIGFALLEFDVL